MDDWGCWVIVYCWDVWNADTSCGDVERARMQSVVVSLIFLYI